MARSLRRLAKRLKGGVATAAEVAEGVYEGTLEVAHDAIDVAEHVAAVPGAALAGILGARAPGPGDIADAAVAADTGPVVPAAPPKVELPIHRRLNLGQRVIELVDGRITPREALLPDSISLWLHDMSEDDRQGLLRFTGNELQAHFRGAAIPGIPLIYTAEEIQARRAPKGLPLEMALRELKMDALCERAAAAARKRGDAEGVRHAENALAVSLALRCVVPPGAYVHEAPAMRM